MWKRPVAWLWILICLASGLLFLFSLDRLWPLARIESPVSDAELVSRAKELLTRRGFDLDGFSSTEWLRVDGPALDYLETAVGRDRAREWIDSGLPVYERRVAFKRFGDSTTYLVRVHPSGAILGWAVSVEDDERGAALNLDAARRMADEMIHEMFALDPAGLSQRAFAFTERVSGRVDHHFAYERELSGSPELRERIRVELAGERIIAVHRRLVVPPSAARSARAAAAPGVALETIGFAALAVAALGALLVFLRRLQSGGVRLGRALVWPVVVLACFAVVSALDSARLFRSWDPLWPSWVSALRFLVLDGMEQLWVLVVLLAVVAAGDALDRSSGFDRGLSLWCLARGRVLDPSVAAASGRGFLIGLLCGGVIAVSVATLELTVGARVGLQPRGFFFYPLNSDSPAATSLLFFWGIALAEELGYRYFGATWLLRLTRRSWLAVILPAVIYGLTHTRLDFLPPAEPFWGRALVLTLVGCVWGWAFLRFDALTVVLSHFTADLFIFNWPRLSAGEALPVATAVATICVPLLPALLYPLAGALRRAKAH